MLELGLPNPTRAYTYFAIYIEDIVLPDFLVCLIEVAVFQQVRETAVFRRQCMRAVPFMKGTARRSESC